MSRSFKKYPVIGIACHKPSSLTKWKRQRARCVRRILNESQDQVPMRVVKKFINRWDAPDDGTQWIPEYKKAWRK
jgi:hypothetical protein